MSEQYDLYLEQHKNGVKMGLAFFAEHYPELLEGIQDIEYHFQNHDYSKSSQEEYEPYDLYFYGEKTDDVKQAFDLAWLHHIHNNPHHWQYWVLVNDDEKDGTKALDMPFVYILEMVCDWWSFSLNKGNFYEIFDWYKEHEKRMILSEKTRNMVEDLLGKIKTKLDDKSQKKQLL